jgi:DNA-binding NarL/FixJ family response regulator
VFASEAAEMSGVQSPLAPVCENKAMAMRKSCVLMAEGQQALLRSMKTLLEPQIEVAAMADNVLSMIDSIRSLDPDVAIIHAGNQHQNQGAMIKHVSQRFPDLRIVIVGDVDDPAILKSLLTQNVKGYVHLQDASTQLIRAVDAVFQGDTFLPTREDSGEDEHVNQHE